MARSTKTTRRVNRHVVEALETAARAAGQGIEELSKAGKAMEAVQAETRLHDDLADQVNRAWANAADAWIDLRARLRAEQDGDGR
jgi:uncharacterized protein YllA (UPF0747 family)